MPFRHGIGWGLAREAVPLSNARCCWWGGWGGSLVVNDLENGLTFAFMMNRMLEGTSGATCVPAVCSLLRILR